MNWTLCIAVWGDTYRARFLRVTLPAIEAALDNLKGHSSAKFIIYTDRPDELQGRFAYPVELRPITATYQNKYLSISAASRQVLHQAHPGDAIAFINADMVPSVEAFTAAEKRFAAGKRLVMCMGTRAFDTADPPIGARSRELLRWAWDHRHHWTAECTWGSGRSAIPSVIYTPVDDGIVLHAFHLHPFAVLKEEATLSFSGVTVDCDLLDYFSRDKIAVVTDADEMSFTELSRPGYLVGATVRRILSPTHVAEYARDCVSEAHRWLFCHRIEIVGPASDQSDVAVVKEILSAIHNLVPKPDWNEKAQVYWSSREYVEALEARVNPLARIIEQVS